MKNKISKTEGTREEPTAKMTTKDGASDKKTTTRRKKITESDIRKRAQEIYEMRVSKGIPGNEDSDWLQAEEELHRKHS